MKNFIPHPARRTVPVLLLAALLAAVILFAEGVYTFSFLQEEMPLPSGSSSSPLASEETSGGTVSTAIPGDDADTGVIVELPAPDSLRTAMSRADVLALCQTLAFTPHKASSLAAQNFALSYEDYSADTSIFALADGFSSLPDARSLYDGYKTVVNYVRPTEMSAPVAQYTNVDTSIPAVQLYMGLVLVDDGETVQLYRSDGTALFSYARHAYTPAFTRAADGSPLFTGTARDEYGSAVTAYYTPTPGGMAAVEYDDEIDGRGVYFDYPPSYGIADNTLMRLATRQTTVTTRQDGTEVVENQTLWAFAYSQSRRLTSYRFTGAFDFSEDLAAVLNDEGQLYYLGKYGYQAFTTLKNYYYYERYVTEYLLPPLTAGPESIGFYYYDHGLVRVRRQVVDWYGITYINTLRVAVDEDILINQMGEEFPIPTGYDIVAYSDGVILLEKDGKYGYMDYTGQWIAQPIYDDAQPFSEGCAVLGFRDGTTMMIDTTGEILIPAGVYTYISNVSSGVVAAWDGEAWSILYKMARFG